MTELYKTEIYDDKGDILCYSIYDNLSDAQKDLKSQLEYFDCPISGSILWGYFGKTDHGKFTWVLIEDPLQEHLGMLPETFMELQKLTVSLVTKFGYTLKAAKGGNVWEVRSPYDQYIGLVYMGDLEGLSDAVYGINPERFHPQRVIDYFEAKGN
jgi:hypothetical protein